MNIMKAKVKEKNRIIDGFIARIDSGDRVVLYDWEDGDITYFIKEGDDYVLISAQSKGVEDQDDSPYLKRYMDEDEARFRLISNVPIYRSFKT